MGAIHDQLRGGPLLLKVRHARGGLSVTPARDRRRECQREFELNAQSHFSFTSIVFSSRASAEDAPNMILTLPGSTTKLCLPASQ